MSENDLDKLYVAGHRPRPESVADIPWLNVEQTENVERVSGGIHRNEAALAEKVVSELSPTVGYEKGLCYGFSAMAICPSGGGATSGRRHIMCAPHQSSYCNNGGLKNIEAADMSRIVEFHEEASHRLPPKLEAVGEVLDFAFVDGWHTCDAVLVDFFYIDKLLRQNGVVMFDDADLPSVRDVLRGAVTKLGYAIHTQLSDHDGRPSKRDRIGLEGSCIALRKPDTPRNRNIFFHEQFSEGPA